MPNPRLASTLVERASAGAGTDIPRGDVLLIVGAATSGPAVPVLIEDPKQAYDAFGEGQLARDVDAAFAGARFAARGTGQSVRPNVFALRTQTGSPATLELLDAAGRNSITLTTIDHSRRADQYRVGEGRFGYRIVSPVREVPVNFAVDKTGQSTGNVASSPSQLAAAFRAAFEQELYTQVHYQKARFEITIDSENAIVDEEAGRSIVDFSALNDAAIEALQVLAPSGDAFTMVGREAQSDFAGADSGVYNAILAPDNEDARVYSLTAGKVVEAPAGTQSVPVVGLADAKRVGFGDTNSLLNIRTTGVGAGASVLLATAGELGGDKVSEAYYRVRRSNAGTVKLTDVADFDFAGDQTADADAYRFVFDAKYGIAGDTTGIANLDGASLDYKATTALAYGDRLGDHFSYTHPDAAWLGLSQHFKLELRALGSSDFVSIPLQFGDYAAANVGVVRAHLEYQGGGVAHLTLNQADYDEFVGARFDDGQAFVSYDSCIFAVSERATTEALDGAASGLEYFVSGNEITFNKPLPFALAFRGLRVTQYRLGQDVIVERSEGGNRFVFAGEGTQPGEAGGLIGKLEVIFGADYLAEPGFPVIQSPVSGDPFVGGSSGASADPGAAVSGLKDTLEKQSNDDIVATARFIVPSGVFFDDVVKEYDPTTGTAIERSSGLLAALNEYRQRIDDEGAAGMFFLGARPMKASSQTGRYTDAQKEARVRDLAVVDQSDPARAANLIASGSFPTFVFFDAPATLTVADRTFETSMTAFFAGIRSIVPNSDSLYKTKLPVTVRPLYKYTGRAADGRRFTDVLADPGRINVWTSRRNEILLADEVSGAGLITDGDGSLQKSNLTRVHTVLAANQFRQNAIARMEVLQGPLKTNVAVLRARVEGVLRDEAARTDGIDGLYEFDPLLDIDVYADEGQALSLSARVTVQSLGELRSVFLEVGSAGPDLGSDVSTIPVAG